MTVIDDCEIVGKDYQLIPEGDYEAVLESWETSTRFAKKDQEKSFQHKNGKIYLWFKVDPYNNAGLGDECYLFMALNAKAITLPAGEAGKFKVGARSKYNKMFKRLYGEKVAKYSRSPRTLKNQLFIVRVRTVTQDDKQKSHHANERYSVIDEIICLG